MRINKSTIRLFFLRINVVNLIFGFVWLSFINTTQIFEISTVNYRIATVIFSLVTIIICLILGSSKIYYSKRNKYIFIYFGFAILYLSNIVYDTLYFSNYNTVFEGTGTLFLLTTASFIVLQPASILFLNRESIIQLSKYLPYFLAIPFVLNILINVGSNFHISIERESIFIGVGIINLGALSSILLSYSIIQIIDSSVDVKIKILNGFISIFALLVIGSTATKSGILSTFIIIILYIATKKKLLLSFKFYFSLFVIASTLILTYSFWYPWVELLIWRFVYTIEEGDSSRIYIWSTALQMFLSSPIIGSSFIIPGDAFFHNFVLDAFVTTGLLGGFIFVILNGVAIKFSFNILNLKTGFSFIPIAYLTVFITGMFSSNLFTNWLYWIFLLLVLMLKFGSIFDKYPNVSKLESINI